MSHELTSVFCFYDSQGDTGAPGGMGSPGATGPSVGELTSSN